MTRPNECRPPDGAESGTYHWIKNRDGYMHAAEWDEFSGFRIACAFYGEFESAAVFFKEGWRYVSSCLPPERADE